jgi:predicted protein tyrosine phosphatase
MKRDVLILSQQKFEDKVLPKLKEFKNTFFISILDPGDEDLHERLDNYRTWKFYDLEQDISSYKGVSFDQSREIFEFIKLNEGKDLIVHCHAGVARSAAIGEFYWEMLGGGYKELTEKFPNILPNARVLQYLRVAEKSSVKTEFDKMFI